MRKQTINLVGVSMAVQIQPSSKLYRNNLAAALVLAGRTNEALMHMNQVHGTAIANYNLGYLLYKQGKTAEVNPALCKGDGLCCAKCPTSAVALKHFTDEKVFDQIDAALATTL